MVDWSPEAPCFDGHHGSSWKRYSPMSCSGTMGVQSGMSRVSALKVISHNFVKSNANVQLQLHL